MAEGVSLRLLQNVMERRLISGEGRAYYEHGHVSGCMLASICLHA